MSKNSSDLLVVGGGIIGLSIAEACAREGLAVTLLEGAALGGEATTAAAGMVPAASDHPESTPYERLKGRGSDLFPGLSERLRESTGIDNGFRPLGGVELAPDRAEAEALREEAGEWQRQGVAWREIGVGGLRRLEPAVELPLETAYLLNDYAVFEPDRHVEALAAACRLHGGRVFQGVGRCRLEVREGRVVGATTDDGTHHRAETTVVAAGAWSQGLLAPMGLEVDTRPMRGQVVCLHTPTRRFERVLMWGRRYLVPRSGDRVILGSTEEDVGFEPRTTAAAIHEMLGQALAVVPALAEATVEKTWAGLRPGSPDGLPTIGRVPGFESLLLAVGHYRLGLMMSPSTAEAVSQLARGLEPTVPLTDFDPGRWASAKVLA